MSNTLVSYWSIHPEMKRMARMLRSHDSFVAFEIYAPPTFGAREFLAELVDQLPKASNRDGPLVYKRIRYRVEETEDPRAAACAYISSQLKPNPPDAPRVRYLIEVNNLDRSENVQSKSAEAALRGLDQALINYEYDWQHNAGVALILCNRRRQRGRHPLVTGVDGSVIDRKLQMTAPIRLLKPGEARAVIDHHTQPFNVAVDIRHILAEATGGHPT